MDHPFHDDWVKTSMFLNTVYYSTYQLQWKDNFRTYLFSGTAEYLALMQRQTDLFNELPATEINAVQPGEANHAMLMASKGLSMLHPTHEYPKGRSFKFKGTVLWIPKKRMCRRSLKHSRFKLSNFYVCQKCGLRSIVLTTCIATIAFGMLLAFLYSLYTRESLYQVFRTFLTQFIW